MRKAGLRQVGKTHLLGHSRQDIVAERHHDRTQPLEVVAERGVRHGVGEGYGPRHGIGQRRDVGEADVPAQLEISPHKVVRVRGEPCR